jgi:hypothetical protein
MNAQPRATRKTAKNQITHLDSILKRLYTERKLPSHTRLVGVAADDEVIRYSQSHPANELFSQCPSGTGAKRKGECMAWGEPCADLDD